MSWTKGHWTVCTEQYVDNTIGLYVSAYFPEQGNQDSYGVDICHLDRLYYDSDTLANARLIAKAPEMAELWKKIFALVDDYEEFKKNPMRKKLPPTTEEYRAIENEARQLLAEIEGEGKP